MSGLVSIVISAKSVIPISEGPIEKMSLYLSFNFSHLCCRSGDNGTSLSVTFGFVYVLCQPTKAVCSSAFLTEVFLSF